MRIAACAACDMLPTTMAKLKVTNKGTKDILVWIQDLNSIGPQLGGPIQVNKKLFVELQPDDSDKVYYHWSAEEIVVPPGPAKHETALVGPSGPVGATVGQLPINLDTDANAVLLPLMFRHYP